jgi:hypothetical protein
MLNYCINIGMDRIELVIDLNEIIVNIYIICDSSLRMQTM